MRLKCIGGCMDGMFVGCREDHFVVTCRKTKEVHRYVREGNFWIYQSL